MEFSNREIKDLLKAWFFISLAFTILLSEDISYRGISFSTSLLTFFILSSLTVGLAFLFHEIMHKAVAQKYGKKAEFRAFDKMLVLALVMSFFNFILAAPGAVMIHGVLSKEENGKTSLAGPLTNLILGLAFFIPFFFINLEGILGTFVMLGFTINIILAFFNLLPIPGFDGRKILDWNRGLYFVLISISVLLFFISIANI